MELIIAEKPSVAKSYLQMISVAENTNFTPKQGYYESNCGNYQVSWAVGHLVSLSLPDAYGWNWDLKYLPMIPKEWKYQVNKQTKKQFDVLNSLIKKADIITNGCDAGREGELIFRLIQHKTNSVTKNSNRLWIQQFVIGKMVDAWKSRKNSKEYNNLFIAAMLRQKADWLVGMNFSTGYSLATHTRGLSVGRVQTPTLNLIVQRDQEIKNWQRKFFFQLIGIWKGIEFTYHNQENINSFDNQETLIKINESIKNDVFELIEIKEKESKKYPPNPYDLASLQKDANNKFGLTAAQTLSYTQSLYEKKLVTYPRTDSAYLPEAMKDESTDLAFQLINSNSKDILQPKDFPHKFFNDGKLTDHYAIIPTGETSSDITDNELKVYELIKNRFIQAFCKPHIYKTFKLTLSNSNKNISFQSTISNDIDLGYILLSAPKELNITKLPDLNSKDKFEQLNTVEKEKQKPSYFTEASLISEMENCSKYIENSELKKSLKNANGIGTAATRASIIETLKKRNYITLKSKKIYPSELGIKLVQLVGEKIKSPELTALWENKLEALQNGKYDFKVFINEIEDYIKTQTEVIKKLSTENITLSSSGSVKGSQKLLKCPKCNQESVLIKKTDKLIAFCKGNDDCDFRLYNTFNQKKLSEKNANDLIAKGKTGSITFTSKQGKPYKAFLTLDEKFYYKLNFVK